MNTRAVRISTGVRLASHLTIWSAVLIPTIVQIHRGWRAVSDDATISLEAWAVFSAHSPVVGQYSSASIHGHPPLYDPGPLLFWLLAVPVRVDPAHGSLWGAALAIGAVLSIAIEAMWSAFNQRCQPVRFAPMATGYQSAASVQSEGPQCDGHPPPLHGSKATAIAGNQHDYWHRVGP